MLRIENGMKSERLMINFVLIQTDMNGDYFRWDYHISKRCGDKRGHDVYNNKRSDLTKGNGRIRRNKIFMESI